MNPIMNGVPDMHPLEHVGQLVAEHSTLLRRRLHAAHLHDGLPPTEKPEVNPLSIVQQTRAPGHQNLAQLAARFYRGAGG